MKVTDLLANIRVNGDIPADLAATGLSLDSRRVVAGDLFVALIGGSHDGRVFAPQAAAAGAVAILAEGPPVEPVDVPWLEVESVRPVLGEICSRMWQAPHERLRVIGVTGTNGKTTVAELVASILDHADLPSLRIGTLGMRPRRSGAVHAPAEPIPGVRTSPEAPDLYRTLRRGVDDGAEAAVLEVSSHALAQGRVGGVGFDVAVFTNLSRDHFDFHSGWEDYFAAKRSLFDQLKDGGTAVVCVDDRYGRQIAAELDRVLTYGVDGTIRPRRSQLSFSGIEAEVETPRGGLVVNSRLLGDYNLSNILAAVAVGEALAVDQRAIVSGIAAVDSVDGRLQPVSEEPPAFVDYAHTPAALEAVLTALRRLGARHLILVFGCGGERDPGKRVPMGEVAGRLADLAIVTSDNPRGEDPMRILGAVEEGLLSAGATDYHIEPDRRSAIRMAVVEARPESVIVVAGKGHEQVQIIGNERIPFSDRDELTAALVEQLGAEG